MNEIVQTLYNRFPIFRQLNDSFMDDLDYTVYDFFALFIEDVVELYDLGKFRKDRHFSGVNVEDYIPKNEMEALIEQVYCFIEEKHREQDPYIQDVINTTFFKSVVTSDLLYKYAKRYFSQELLSYIHHIWQVK